MNERRLSDVDQTPETGPESGSEGHAPYSRNGEDRVCTAYGYSKEAFHSDWGSATRRGRSPSR